MLTEPARLPACSHYDLIKHSRLLRPRLRPRRRMEEESRALFLAAARHSSPFPIDISTVEIQLERLLVRRQRVGGNGYHRAFHRALAQSHLYTPPKTGMGNNICTWLRESCRQVEAEVICYSRNNQTTYKYQWAGCVKRAPLSKVKKTPGCLPLHCLPTTLSRNWF